MEKLVGVDVVAKGLNDAVIWLGLRQDLEEIMPALAVQVTPSLAERFPLPLAEGIAPQSY